MATIKIIETGNVSYKGKKLFSGQLLEVEDKQHAEAFLEKAQVKFESKEASKKKEDKKKEEDKK